MNEFFSFLKTVTICGAALAGLVILLIGLSTGFRRMLTGILTFSVFLSWVVAILYVLNPLDIPGPIDDAVVVVMAMVWSGIVSVINTGLSALMTVNSETEQERLAIIAHAGAESERQQARLERMSHQKALSSRWKP